MSALYSAGVWRPEHVSSCTPSGPTMTTNGSHPANSSIVKRSSKARRISSSSREMSA